MTATLHPFFPLSDSIQNDYALLETQETKDFFNKMRSDLIPYVDHASMQISASAYDVYKYLHGLSDAVILSEAQMDEFQLWKLLERQKRESFNLFGGERYVITYSQDTPDSLCLMDMLGYSSIERTFVGTPEEEAEHNKRMEDLKRYDKLLRDLYTYTIHFAVFLESSVGYDHYLNSFLDDLIQLGSSKTNPLNLNKEELYELYTRKLICICSKNKVSQSTHQHGLGFRIKTGIFGTMRDLYPLPVEDAFEEFENLYSAETQSGMQEGGFSVDEHKAEFELRFVYIQSPEAGGHCNVEPQELLDMMQAEISNNFSDVVWNGSFEYDEDAELYTFIVTGSILNTCYIEQDLHNLIDSCLWIHGVSEDCYDIEINESLVN